VAGVGYPGDEDVVRMVDEVVSREGVDELAVAAVVCNGDGDELAVTCCRREAPSPSEKPVSVRREQRGRDEDQWIVARLGRFHNRVDRRVVARYETSEQLVHGHDNREAR